MTRRDANALHFVGAAVLSLGIAILYVAERCGSPRQSETAASEHDSHTDGDVRRQEPERRSDVPDDDRRNDVDFDPQRQARINIGLLVVLIGASAVAMYVFADSQFVEGFSEYLGAILFGSDAYGALVAPRPYASAAFLTVVFGFGWGLRTLVDPYCTERPLVPLLVGLVVAPLLTLIVVVSIYRLWLVPAGVPVELISVWAFTPSDVVRSVVILTYGALFTLASESVFKELRSPDGRED